MCDAHAVSVQLGIKPLNCCHKERLLHRNMQAQYKQFYFNIILFIKRNFCSLSLAPLAQPFFRPFLGLLRKIGGKNSTFFFHSLGIFEATWFACFKTFAYSSIVLRSHKQSNTAPRMNGSQSHVLSTNCIIQSFSVGNFRGLSCVKFSIPRKLELSLHFMQLEQI